MGTEDSLSINPEAKKLRRNDQFLIDSITYISCNGKQIPEAQSIHNLWGDLVNEYFHGKRERNYFSKGNRGSGSDSFRPVERVVVNDVVRNNQETLFIAALNSIIADERHVGDVEYSLRGKTERTPFLKFQEKVTDEFLKSLDNIRTSISFTSPDNPSVATSKLNIDGNTMDIIKDDKVILTITLNSEFGRTEMHTPYDSKIGSGVDVSVDSRKAYWVILRNLAFGDVHPAAESVNAFASSLNFKQSDREITPEWLKQLDDEGADVNAGDD